MFRKTQGMVDLCTYNWHEIMIKKWIDSRKVNEKPHPCSDSYCDFTLKASRQCEEERLAEMVIVRARDNNQMFRLFKTMCSHLV